MRNRHGKSPNPATIQPPEAAPGGAPAVHTTTDVRMDKWLWAVRLYKSRSIAAGACTSGKVLVGGHIVKASRSVKLGEVITAVTGEITRTVKVTGLLESRVGAKLVGKYIEDLTPASEYEKPREKNFLIPAFQRPKGAGRPTKKDRRSMNPFIS
ncbi:MAG TPA: RNA-binding S4 domain-containing protein [Candidatus Saccharimonadales bacterium]|nr:RNA-binding S4 domain-containing protein [Candidatus Saccharimonadales bacterium]